MAATRTIGIPGAIDRSGENGEERIGFTAVIPDWTLSLESTLRLDQSEIEETDAFDDVISRAMRKNPHFGAGQRDTQNTQN